MRYLPHTPEEVAEMLATIGKGSIDELFETVPEKARFNGQLDVPAALDEPTLMTHLAELADKNDAKRMLSFLGGGMYAHHIPPAVDQLLLRSEFYTAYTPYQPEVAQGTLQAIWEFQTVVSELLGLPLSNASLYDGASATAEAALMACRLQKRDKVVLSECVHPDYRAVTHTYLSGEGQDRIVKVPVGKDGRADTQALIAALSDDVAAVIVGYPSFLGPVSDLSALADAVHEKGALLVTATAEPYALAVCQPPGAMGADIAVGEGQPLACPPQFGGPGVGLFAFQALVAVWQLELTNYVEHYGLTRKYLGDGRYEPVRPHHSWDSTHAVSNLLLINLQRHADHHVHPQRRFPLLQSYGPHEVPQLPTGYPPMTAMAMIPPLWRRRFNPRVREWRRRFYPEITDWTAYKNGTLPMPRGAG